MAAFCLYHMGAMLFANMDSSTAFGDDLRAPFDRYTATFGLWQDWELFLTVPVAQSINPVLVAHYANGKDVERGPILPGLKRYHPRARFIALFVRLSFPGDAFEWVAERYLERACGAFERALGSRPETVRIRMDSEQLIPLEEVIRTGKMGSPLHQFGTAVGKCRSI